MMLFLPFFKKEEKVVQLVGKNVEFSSFHDRYQLFTGGHAWFDLVLFMDEKSNIAKWNWKLASVVACMDLDRLVNKPTSEVETILKYLRQTIVGGWRRRIRGKWLYSENTRAPYV